MAVQRSAPIPGLSVVDLRLLSGSLKEAGVKARIVRGRLALDNYLAGGYVCIAWTDEGGKEGEFGYLMVFKEER
jgi:hypothetical protein